MSRIDAGASVLDVGTTTNTPAVRIAGLSKAFRRQGGETVTPVDNMSLDVAVGEFVVLLGPSGCGKTTLLRCIAGLERPDSGVIEISGRKVLDAGRIEVPVDQRGISMVFQSYALWPHLTIFDNVAYPIKRRGMARPEIRRRVLEALEVVGIGSLVDSYPGQISGGQQQRVALARALVARNSLILFDEPLSNVDAKVRDRLRIDLMQVQREVGFAAVYVTHDQNEAMELADRIVVLDKGRILQSGSPRAVYQEPANSTVARFIGVTNEIDGRIHEISGSAIVLDTPFGLLAGRAMRPGLAAGTDVVAIVRPEHILMTAGATARANSWQALLQAVVFSGAHTEYIFESSGQQFRTRGPDSVAVARGDIMFLSVEPSNVLVYPVQ